MGKGRKTKQARNKRTSQRLGPSYTWGSNLTIRGKKKKKYRVEFRTFARGQKGSKYKEAYTSHSINSSILIVLKMENFCRSIFLL